MSILPPPTAPNKSFPQTGWSWMTNWPSMTRHSAKSLPRRPLVLAMSPRGLFHQHPASSPKYTHKKYKAGNHLYGESLKPKSRVRAQIMSLGTHTKFQHETLTRDMTSALHKLTQTSRGHYESLVKHPWLVGVQCTHCSPSQPGECCLVACSSTKPHSPRGHGNQECNKVCQSDKVVIVLQK